MPPIAKALALVVVVAGPVCLAGQTYPPHDSTARRNETPTEASQSARLHPPVFRIPGRLVSPSGPQSGEVVQAAFQSPLPADNAPVTSGETAVSGEAAVSGNSVPSAEPAPSQGDFTKSVPLPPRGREALLPLAPPGSADRKEGKPGGPMGSLVTVLGSLAVVLGVFFLVAWCMRRAAPPGSTALPGEVFEILGRAPMANRQQVHLLRCGRKLLLVSVTPAGAETLTEITDPVEVDRLAGLCQQARPNSATSAFRQVFGQFAPRHPRSGSLPGLLGESDYGDARLAGTGVLATHDGMENRDV